MTRRLGAFVAILVLTLGLAGGATALADTGTSGQTDAGIVFKPNPATGSSADSSTNSETDQDIPNGKQPTPGAGSESADRVSTGEAAARKDKTTKSSTTPQKKSGIGAVVTGLLTGKLPQTNETQSVLVTLVGGLLLVVALLVAIIVRQARLLKERE